jgi:tRNA (guanine-N7-)-methyltransferase
MGNAEPGGAPIAHRRTIRSYVLRAGRMTDAQTRALAELWPRFGVAPPTAPLDLAALFGRRAPVTLEIGFGNGANLAAMAAAQPEQDFLGIEVHAPGVGNLLRATANAGLTNLRVLQHDAVEVLRAGIAPASLAAILVLFPDPWPKKRHHKRRLINAGFVELATSRLVPGGTLQLATDWLPYAEAMLEVLNASPGLRNCAADGRFVARNPGRVRTRFETRGERLGHQVRDLCFVRSTCESPADPAAASAR